MGAMVVMAYPLGINMATWYPLGVMVIPRGYGFGHVLPSGCNSDMNHPLGVSVAILYDACTTDVLSCKSEWRIEPGNGNSELRRWV